MKAIERTFIFVSCVFFAYFPKKIKMQNELFEKIVTIQIENKQDTFKEVFLSRIIEENFLGSFLTCRSLDMELLRVESLKEVSYIFQAVKLFWLDFEEELYIDGVKSTSQNWKYLSSGKEIDRSIFGGLEEDLLTENSNYIKIAKNGTSLNFVIGNSNSYRKFLCQKEIKRSEKMEENVEITQNGTLLKVDVVSRIFEKLGSFERFINSKFIKSTIFINRNYGLSYTKATRFCENFGLKLLNIDTKEKYEQVVNVLLRSGVGIDKNFMIGNLRESFLQTHSWANAINENSNHGRKEKCISILINRLNQHGQAVYFDCNDDYTYQHFVCEETQEKSIWSQDYPKSSYQSEKVAMKTTGMKLIGSIEKCRIFNSEKLQEMNFIIASVYLQQNSTSMKSKEQIGLMNFLIAKALEWTCILLTTVKSTYKSWISLIVWAFIKLSQLGHRDSEQNVSGTQQRQETKLT